MTTTRRAFLQRAAAATGAGLTPTLFPAAIRKALAIAPHRRTGTIQDVEHIVILMQENRSFDHYFGTLEGVRGFGDRFPIPVPNSDGVTGKTVCYQNNGAASPAAHVVAPFRLDTQQSFELMRVTGTPHGWTDAQHAWANGVLSQWPRFKRDHAMGFFTEDDIPFQFALAQAFTICDAYHCSIMSSTNPNRLFLWTGTNDPLQRGGGPAINNDFDNLDHDPDGGYTWVTYCERLQAAGISWQIYENMDDNFTDNSVAGFKTFRDAYNDRPGSLAALKERGLLRNGGKRPLTFKVDANAYRYEHATVEVGTGCDEHRSWSLHRSGFWYDFTVTIKELPGFSRRFAGRVETGRDSFSDPAMGGPARGDQE